MSRRNERLREGRPEAQQLREQAEESAIYDRNSAKQYVRRFGWLEIIEDYVDRFRRANVNRPWKYLTLPGQHASDIGLLWRAGLLSKVDERRLNVAICDHEYAATVTANLAKYGDLLAVSDRWIDEELRLTESQLAREFPFDVINLDLCNSLLSPLRSQANLEAIEWIFRLQRRQSFLLLLTTRPAIDARGRLLSILRANLRNERLFREAYIDQYRSTRPEPCLRDYTAFTQITIPKAIAEWGRYWGYKTNERFVARYTRPSRRGRRYDYEMICHSFEFEQIGARQNSSRYEPRFKRVPRSNIDDRLQAQKLSSTIRTQAIDSYIEFVISLLTRASFNITNFLSSHPDMEAELQAEADSLIGWC